MAVVTIAANVTGIADEEDRRAMVHVIDAENARRAALDPPGVALTKSTAVERRTSYETVMAMRLGEIHASYIAQSNVASLADVRALWATATDAKRNAALAALQ